MSKKSGDNYPLDIKGQMLFIGTLVCVPVRTVNDPDRLPVIELKLGYIKKLTQKRGVDVTIFHDVTKTETIRYVSPSTEINAIEKSQFKQRDPLHEAIKFAAGTAAADE